MFTGIIEAFGTVVSVLTLSPHLSRLTVTGPSWLAELPRGASVAVNGVTLSALPAWSAWPEQAEGLAPSSQLRPPAASFDVMSETMRVTSLEELRPGGLVNLERALRADARLDGHVVQGHVDGVARVLSFCTAPGRSTLRFSLVPDVVELVALKGSVALHGVSLTVSAVSEPGSEDPWAEVCLIPETMARTVLGAVVEGDRLNLEVDVLARYAQRRSQVRHLRLPDVAQIT